MESPLTNLSNVLATVRASAESYETTLKKNEAATRAALIDPVLRALGWDIANPFMVGVETSGMFENKISADYALKTDGEVQIVVEAKKLDADLGAFYQQAVKYSFGFGVKQVFLTNGIIWEHFTEFNPSDLKPAMHLDLKSDDLEEVAAYLVQELDAALISPQEGQIEVLSEEVAQLREEVAKLRDLEERLKFLESKYRPDPKRIKQPSVAKETPKSFPSDSWTSLEYLSEVEFSKVKRTKPKNLRLPDGSEVIVKAWNQVLLECCRYVLKSNPNIQIPLPDVTSGKNNLIQSVPYPKNLNSKEIDVDGRTLYVHVNYRADGNARNAFYILSFAGDGRDRKLAAVIYE